MTTATTPASREAQADLSGRRLTRDERKALRIADLTDCTPERRAVLKDRAEMSIAYLGRVRSAQLENGICVDDARHARNLSTHLLMLECLAST